MEGSDNEWKRIPENHTRRVRPGAHKIVPAFLYHMRVPQDTDETRPQQGEDCGSTEIVGVDLLHAQEE